MRRTKRKHPADKRKTKRWHLVFYLRVFDGHGQRIVGHLVDISTRGLMLVSDEPIEKGRSLPLRMKLPKEQAGRQELTFSATCRWCRQDTNPDFYIAGFRIDSIPPELPGQLRQLVDDFSIEESLKPADADCPACSLTHTAGPIV
jgi:hypothetical protein